MGLKANRDTFGWKRGGMVYDLLIRNCFLHLKFCHHIMHENKNLQPCVFSPGAHSRPSPKGYVRIWRRPASFESWWIEFFWLRKVFGILVCWVYCPKCLQEVCFESLFYRLWTIYLGALALSRFQNSSNLVHFSASFEIELHSWTQIKSLGDWTLTFHPFGMVKPAYVKSVVTALNAPWAGGDSLIASRATFHVYFIFSMSSHVSNSPGFFDLAISICSGDQHMRTN